MKRLLVALLAAAMWAGASQAQTPRTMNNADVTAALGFAPLSSAALAAPNGIATLDATGNVPLSQLGNAPANGSYYLTNSSGGFILNSAGQKILVPPLVIGTTTGTAGDGGVLATVLTPHVSGNATPDSTTSTTGGGSQPNAGDWNVTAGAGHFFDPYGAEILRISIGATPATEFLQTQPGTYGIGATLGSYSNSDPSVPLNLVTKGAGSINFSSGSGDIMSLLDAGAGTTAKLTVTPGTTANSNTVTLGSSGNVLIASTGGVGLGAGAIVYGGNSAGVGNQTRVYGTNDFLTGTYGNDQPTGAGAGTLTAVRCHMSGIVAPSYAYGGNQACEQTLGTSVTGSGSVAATGRMTIDGGTFGNGYGHAMGFAPNGHGHFLVTAECSLAASASQAYWKIEGWFNSLSGTFTINGMTGNGTTTATGTLSTMSLSMTYDSSNRNANLTVTLPAGVTTSAVYCGAHATWEQRIT